MTDLPAVRAFAHHLADLADAITLPAFHRGVSVEAKSDGTPVTATDREVEATLRAAIAERFTDHAVLGEEDGRVGAVDAPTWVVDPIDATRNFASGVPVFATLVAFAVDDRPLVGVVSAPALRTRWDGIADGPARQDGRAIRVSDTSSLAAATVSFGGLDYFDARASLEVVGRLARSTARQRGFGDFWQHCLVASGAIDVAVEAEVSRWDLAAVKVVVEAAGGRLTDLTGVDTDDGGSAVTTNGHLHEAVLHTIGATSA